MCQRITTSKPEIKKLVDFIVSDELLEIGQKESLERLHNELIVKDWFMTLLDVEDYIKRKKRRIVDYEDRRLGQRRHLSTSARLDSSHQTEPSLSTTRTFGDYNIKLSLFHSRGRRGQAPPSPFDLGFGGEQEVSRL